ncbi:unnamed protein product [Leptosia nina]|uniref:PSP proline-rich domain-containing protein n=1 Tax=Leptosia nina TaxID=320188 RepID=A0AAV1J6V2_9NEOP
MAKRKAGVNDIIYELSNEDLSGSSDDEHKITKTKISKPNDENKTSSVQNKHAINIGSQNGGKNDTCKFKIDSTVSLNNSIHNTNCSNDNGKKSNTDSIFNKDIDSPDFGDGCVSRAPLVSVRFKDNKLAKAYKTKIKKFMLDLIKLHDSQSFNIDSDSDIELDIWPEDFEEEVRIQTPPPVIDNNLFFIDTDPNNVDVQIPMYKKASQSISNNPVEENSDNRPVRSQFVCFNCDGEHQLKDCPKPRNHARVAEKRRNMGVKLGRYHVEDDQKYGHLIPGRISGQLRYALGLKRYELPLHIYRMRLLGYPCGWMEEAKILPSGINMFDSSGTRILEPDEEEGEVSEPGSKDLYDIKKILDFPGFNVPASSKYMEESHLYGLPPMSEEDSKILMLQRLAPNAMKAYKRKKLTLFPSSANNSQEGQAEMELDSGDEIPEFPSVPPLPDEEPPKAPSPPPLPPGTPPAPPPPEKPNKPETKPEIIVEIMDRDTDTDNKSLDDIEIVEVMQVPDIPMPEDDLITIDEDDEISFISSDRNSPTIDDLEAKKQQLLDAINNADVTTDSGTDTDAIKEIMSDKSRGTADDSVIILDDTLIESDKEVEFIENDKIIEKPTCTEDLKSGETTDTKIDNETRPSDANNTREENESSENAVENLPKTDKEIEAADATTSDDTETASATTSKDEHTSEEKTTTDVSISKGGADTKSGEDVTLHKTGNDTHTPDAKTGKVRETHYGAPIMNIASPYEKLPSDDKFAKDICDVINFENLPNSTGKYKKISSLLKKVKSEVDRIQES